MLLIFWVSNPNVQMAHIIKYCKRWCIAMAMYMFRDCLASELSTQEIIKGSFIVCRDTGDMYCDSLEGVRLTIAKFIHVVNGSIDSELYPEEGHLYYSATDNSICFYSNGKMNPINTSMVLRQIHNCYIAKSATAEIQVNDAANSIVGTNGTIITVIPVKHYTNEAIADLDGQFNVSIGAAKKSPEGIWSVPVTNGSDSLNWMGTIEVAIITTVPYSK